MPILRGNSVPVYVQHDQVLLIHWRCADGSLFVERRTMPPAPTQAAREPLPAAAEREDETTG